MSNDNSLFGFCPDFSIILGKLSESVSCIFRKEILLFVIDKSILFFSIEKLPNAFRKDISAKTAH